MYILKIYEEMEYFKMIVEIEKLSKNEIFK